MVQFTRVVINSITVKDDSSTDPKQIIGWEYEKEEDSPVTEIELTAPRTIFDLVDVSNGQIVEVYSSEDDITYTRIFYGAVDKVEENGASYTITCKNELYALVRQNVNKIYDSSIDPSAGKLSAIAEDLITTQGGLLSDVQDSGTVILIDEFKCINTDIYERVQAIKNALGWSMYYNDTDRTTYLEPQGFTDSMITLTTGDNIVGVPKWEFDNSQMINDLIVQGATIQTHLTESGQIGVTSGFTTTGITLTKTPDSAEVLIDAADPPTTQLEGGTKDASTAHDYYIDRENKGIIPATGTTFTSSDYAIVNYNWSADIPIHMVNQESIDTYGLYESVMRLSDITSVADAESRAKSILSRLSVPFITGTMMVKSNVDIKLGELVTVQDNITRKTVNGQYMVSKITYKYPSPFNEVKIGDKEWRLADWQENTEARLKRLEEQFVRNQDIITELREFKNTALTGFKTPVPRYRKVLTQTLSGTNLFILGHPTYGVLGTNQLGDSGVGAETDAFVQQYQDEYTEEFVDSDFESTNTTATLGSGSVSFTSGQIAESESIDYNNGTITTAKLTSTEVSGSFDYEMTANGTDWESVTSGVAHTFTETGTDLRWRATENAASTGEISELKIEDYH